MRLIVVLCLCALAASLNAESWTGDRILRHGFEEKRNADETPRVRIKVFRSPTKEENGEQYATWGFWVKQPANV